MSALFAHNEELGPRGSTANFLQQPPVTPNQVISALLPPSIPLLVPCTPSAMACVDQLHPVNGFHATNNEGQACLVTYNYRAAQTMALVAPSSKTPSDPQSIDLPSMVALSRFYHACLGFPVKQIWLKAIKASNCDSFDGLTYSNVLRYCLDADKTIMGHLAQQCQNICLTKPTHPTAVPTLTLHPPPVPPLTEDIPSNKVFVCVYPISKLYTDNTGHFPIKTCSGNHYVTIAFHTDGNLILQQAFKNRSDTHHIAAYNSIMTCLAARGLSVDLQILDNEASAAYKQTITFTWQAISVTMLSTQFGSSRTTSCPS